MLGSSRTDSGARRDRDRASGVHFPTLTVIWRRSAMSNVYLCDYIRTPNWPFWRNARFHPG